MQTYNNPNNKKYPIKSNFSKTLFENIKNGNEDIVFIIILQVKYSMSLLIFNPKTNNDEELYSSIFDEKNINYDNENIVSILTNLRICTKLNPQYICNSKRYINIINSITKNVL